ncbi:flagellar hook-length control protein FliK [Kosakonia arachidis]|uniref:Flagellar hook-length control protein FliK n=1 Tax=Kosakonia arachidis TaxID=551989 RepID=A0A1I7E895_9ENTR|nr:flagellar hook-length control protein FliK [Kosakonia arachidis]SFU20129.1 flagellar hook-length control protein FliK [Kosakonia arachidis]
MMVAKIPAVSPLAEGTPASGEMLNDGQAFTSLLNEKTSAMGPATVPASNGLVDRLKRFAAEESTDDADSPEADMSGESLLALLNQTLEEREATAAGDAKKGKAAPGDDVVQPLPQAITADVVQPQPATTVLSGEAAQVSSDGMPAPFSEDRVAGLDINKADSNALPVTGVNINPTFHSLPAGSGDNASQTEPGASLAVEQSQLTSTPAMKTPFSGLENQGLMAKVNADRHEASQESLKPDLTLSAPAPSRSDNSTINADSTLNTGVLNQEMGTPGWQQSLGQQIACFTRNGVQHAELRLHPEELGSLQVNLQLKNDQAQLHFVSDSHQVRAAIEAAVPHLRTSLAESGIELSQSSVDSGTSSWSDSSQQEKSSQQNFVRQDQPEALSFVGDNVETSSTTVSYNLGVNTFA